MGWLIGGTVIVETVFAVPGLGALMISAIFARDYPLVQVITLVFALLMVAINLLTDPGAIRCSIRGSHLARQAPGCAEGREIWLSTQ